MQIKTKSGYFYRNKANFPLACRKQIIKVVFLSVLDFRDVIYRHASQFITLQSDSLLVTATPPIIAFCTRRWDGLHYL